MHQFDAVAEADSRVQLLRAQALEAAGDHDGAARARVRAWELDDTDPVKAYDVVQRVPSGVPADRARAHAVVMDAYRRAQSGESPSPKAPFPNRQLIPDTWSETPVVADANLAIAFPLLVASRYDEAVDALRRTDFRSRAHAADAPLDRFAAARRAELTNRVTEARRNYEAALQGTLLARHALYVGIGRLAQVDGDDEAAIDAFRSAARLHPNNAFIRKELAAALAAVGRHDESFAELVAVVLIDPRDAQAYAAIGHLFVDTDRLDEAISAFSRSLHLAPERYEIHYAMAGALTRLGKAAEAERELEAFERARLQMQDRRRREIAGEVEEEDRRRRQPGGQVR